MSASRPELSAGRLLQYRRVRRISSLHGSNMPPQQLVQDFAPARRACYIRRRRRPVGCQCRISDVVGDARRLDLVNNKTEPPAAPFRRTDYRRERKPKFELCRSLPLAITGTVESSPWTLSPAKTCAFKTIKDRPHHGANGADLIGHGREADGHTLAGVALGLPI